MPKFLHPDSQFMRAISHFGNLVILSLLWTLCSLPIITAGASTAALYGVLLSYGATDAGVSKRFFHAFRQNWKQASVLWLIILLAAFVLWVDYALLTNGLIQFSSFHYIIAGIVVLLLMWGSWLFPTCAYYKNSTLRTCRLSFLLAIGRLPKTLLMTVLNAIPFVIFWTSPLWFFKLIFIWPFLGVGLTAWLNSRLIKSVFKKNIGSQD